MERVLLWLDEIEDIIFLAAIVWPHVRRLCLASGLMAALIIALIIAPAEPPARAAGPQLALLSAIASASVGLWLVGLLATLLSRAARGNAAASA